MGWRDICPPITASRFWYPKFQFSDGDHEFPHSIAAARSSPSSGLARWAAVAAVTTASQAWKTPTLANKKREKKI